MEHNAEKKRPRLHRVYTCVCIGVSLLVLAAFLVQIRISRSAMLTHSQQLVRSAHEQSEGLLSTYFTNLGNTFQELCYSPSIQEVLKEDPAARYQYYSEVKQVFSVLGYVQPEVVSYALYDGEGQRVQTNTISDTNYQTIILDDHIVLPEDIVYQLIYPSNRFIGITLPMYVISLPVYEFSGVSSARIGAVVLAVDRRNIQDLLGVNMALDGCSQVLADGEGKILAEVGPSLRGEDGRLDNALLNDRQLVLESSISNNGWKLYTTLETDVISEDMLPLFYSSILIWLLLLAVVVVVLYLFRKQVLGPVRQVSHFMRHASHHTAWDHGLPCVHHYEDESLETFEEFFTMEKSMNQMLDDLHQQTVALVKQQEQSHQAELLARQMEILAYRSQINPHFLYNTLDCIRGIAMSRGATEIVEISQSLSMIFRYVIKGGSFSTLGEELGHLEKYRTIIYYRFMGRITIDVQSEPDIDNIIVPRLIIQPLVENAVFHGLEGKLGEGHVQVDLKRQGDKLRILVSDDGLGMDAEALQAVEDSLKAPPDSGQTYHVGLANIAHRLRLYYPEGGGLHIQSAPGKGTTVELILGAITEEEQLCIKS